MAFLFMNMASKVSLQLILTPVIMIIIFFLPGYLLWKLLAVRSVRFRKLCQEEYGIFSAILIQTVVSILVSGTFGYILAETGFLKLHLLLACTGIFCITILITGGPLRLWREKAYAPTRILGLAMEGIDGKFEKESFSALRKYILLAKNIINLVLLRNEVFYIPLLIIVAVFMFTEPIQNIWRGRRDGAESLCGIRLARSGGFLVEEPLLADMPERYMNVLFKSHSSTNGDVADRRMRFPSYFIISDKKPDSTYPSFLHFHSAWQGIAIQILGIPGFYYITPFFGVISVCMVFLFAKTLSSIKTAFLATLLLTLNMAQAYFARFSSPVIASQLFIFSGLLMFMIFSSTGLKTFGVLSGIAFGQAVLCGNGLFHYFILAGSLSFCAAYTPRKHARIHYRYAILPFIFIVFIATLFDSLAGSGNIPAIAGGFISSMLGSGRVYNFTTGMLFVFALAIPVFIILSAIISHYRNRLLLRPFFTALKHRDGLPVRILGYGLIIIYLVWFYISRPPYLSYEGTNIYPNKWIHKFMDELGLLFLIVGVIFFIHFRFIRKRQHMVFFPTFLFLIFALENVWNPGTSPVLIYGFRKFIPLFLPFSYFLVAYSLFAFREITRDLEFGRYFGATIAVASAVLLLLTARQGLLLKTLSEDRKLSADIITEYNERIINKLERAQISPEETVFLFAPGTRDPLVPITLTYLFNVESIQLNDEVFYSDHVVDIAGYFTKTGREVFLVLEGMRIEDISVPAELKLIPFGESVISVPRLEETYGERIRSINEKGRDPAVFFLYRIVEKM